MIEHERNDEDLGADRQPRCHCCGARVHATSRRQGEAGERRAHERAGADGAGARRDGAGGRGDLLGAGTLKAVGAGALVAAGVMLLAANRDRLRTAVKGTIREYYRFSDWLGSNLAQVKEDLSDMAAEARHDQEQETTRYLELLEKERELAQRLANMAKKRSEES